MNERLRLFNYLIRSNLNRSLSRGKDGVMKEVLPLTPSLLLNHSHGFSNQSSREQKERVDSFGNDDDRLYDQDYRRRLASAYRKFLRSINKTFNKDQRNKSKVKSLTKVHMNSNILKNLNDLKEPSITTTMRGKREEENGEVYKRETEKSSNLDEFEDRKKRIRGLLESELIGILDLSNFFRKNLVQGELSDDRKTLRLNITEDTELGDNSTIKNPKKHSRKTCL